MNNYNNYYGNGYSSMPSSSRSFEGRSERNERWRSDMAFTTRDESWRGNLREIQSPDRIPHNDSWRVDSRDFQLGRDRAPMPVDDTFLVRYGAKRLHNGNLVDRDGYTLRERDPDCRAPSPPTFNPVREIRMAERYSELPTVRQSCSPSSQTNTGREIHSPQTSLWRPNFNDMRGLHNGLEDSCHSPKKTLESPKPVDFEDDDLDKKARLQIELMKQMEIEEERKRKRKRETIKEEPEGEDECEDASFAERGLHNGLENSGHSPRKTLESPKPVDFENDDLNKFQKARLQFELTKQMEIGEEWKRKRKRETIKKEPEGEDECEDASFAEENPPIQKALLSTPPHSTTSSSTGSRDHQPYVKKTLIPVKPSCPPIQGPQSWYRQYLKQVESIKEKTYCTPATSTAPPSVAPQTGFFFQSIPLSATSSGASPSLRASSSSTPSPYYNHHHCHTSKPAQVDLPPPGVAGLDAKHPPLASSPILAKMAASSSKIQNPVYSSEVKYWSNSQQHHDIGSFFGTRMEMHGSQQPTFSPPLQHPSDSDSEDDEAIQKLQEIIKDFGNR